MAQVLTSRHKAVHDDDGVQCAGVVQYVQQRNATTTPSDMPIDAPSHALKHAAVCYVCMLQIGWCMFLLAAIGVGIFLYLRMFRRAPVAPYELGPGVRWVTCPYLNSSYHHFSTGSRGAPSPPAVVENGTWTASLCWYQNASAVQYILQSDDWWTANASSVDVAAAPAAPAASSFTTVYRGPDTFANMTHLLPGSRYHVRLASMGSNNVTSPFSATAVVDTIDRGSCGNAADMAVFKVSCV